jgi:hypothetical protein
MLPILQGAARAEPAEEPMFDLAAHGIKDIDAADMHDPNSFGSYAPQIYGYFKAMEVCLGFGKGAARASPV